MNCPACACPAPSRARFCPACGKSLDPPRSEGQPDGSISDAACPTGAWHWMLLLLLTGERILALLVFQVDESRWLAGDWERPFLWAWGLALGLPAMVCLAKRWRAGGWLAAVSGMALAARASLPLVSESRVSEGQVYGGVVAFMVASATLTFAFLFEQSHWARNPEID